MAEEQEEIPADFPMTCMHCFKVVIARAMEQHLVYCGLVWYCGVN